MLQYVQSHREIADTLERGQYVFCDGPDVSAPIWLFPLHNGNRLIALLSLTFPPHARSSHAVLSRVKRLCEAAAPLLADGQDRAHESDQAFLALADANRQLDAQAQVRSYTLRNSVHDLQTPLVALLGYSRLMLREEAGPLTASQREYLGTILENMLRMTSELKDLSELAKSGPLRFTFFDLASVWPDVLKRIQAGAKGIPVAIEARFSERPFLMVADETMLSEALDSVISYVIQRTVQGGVVAVRFDRGDEIVVRITTGDLRDFEEESHDRASARRPDELAAARRAMRLHGGGVAVSRSIGKGLTLTVTLPIVSWKDQCDPEDVHEQAFGTCGG